MQRISLPSNIKAILRLQLKRNLQKSLQIDKKYRICVFLSSEFHETVDFIPTVDYQLKLINAQGEQSASIKFKVVSKTRVETNIDFKIEGTTEGEWRLFVEALHESHESEEYILLPFISDFFRLTSAGALLSTYELASLCNYRLITAARTLTSESYVSIWTKEEYGLTIGSHIYDSSVVLIHYLSSLSECFENKIELSHNIVELGSGCGLVSLYCILAHQCTAISTDRKDQLGLLAENFDVNQIMDKRKIVEFDWNIPDQFQSLKSELLDIFTRPETRLNYILAADVLYDASVIHQFLRILVGLFVLFTDTNLFIPTILIAQKNRKHLSSDLMQHELLQYYYEIVNECQNIQLDLFCVYEMANVFVWKFRFTLSS
eukprot:gene406-438_t